MTPEQIRAARALLDVSQGEVAEATNITVATLSNAEKGKSTLSQEIHDRVKLFFVSRGLEFTEYNGVREAPSGLQVYTGRKGFKEFYDFQYEKLRKYGGDIWLYNGVSALFIDALGAEFLEVHKNRMMKIKDRFTYRVIVEEGDETAFGSDYAEYRGVPAAQFNDKTIFVFCGVVAFVDFSGELTVTAIEKKEIADTIGQLMLNSWESADDT